MSHAKLYLCKIVLWVEWWHLCWADFILSSQSTELSSTEDKIQLRQRAVLFICINVAVYQRMSQKDFTGRGEKDTHALFLYLSRIFVYLRFTGAFSFLTTFYFYLLHLYFLLLAFLKRAHYFRFKTFEESYCFLWMSAFPTINQLEPNKGNNNTILLMYPSLRVIIKEEIIYPTQGVKVTSNDPKWRFWRRCV